MICQLKNERIRCLIDPQGATIIALQIDGIDVLQSCEEKVTYTKDESGGFPLIPIANRVEFDCYPLGSTIVKLNKNELNGSEYLHGIGWTSTWTIEQYEVDPLGFCDYLKLSLHSQGDVESLYKFTGILEISLKDSQVDFILSVKHEANEHSTEGRLYGLGMHPYFAMDLGDELLVNALGYCEAKEKYLVAEPSEQFDPDFDYRSFKEISDRFANHSYVGCNGVIIKRNKHQAMFKMVSNCSNLMMYHQEQHNFIALEPQTHMVNGANRIPDRGGMVLLNHDFDTLSMQMQISKVE